MTGVQGTPFLTASCTHGCAYMGSINGLSGGFLLTKTKRRKKSMKLRGGLVFDGKRLCGSNSIKRNFQLVGVHFLGGQARTPVCILLPNATEFFNAHEELASKSSFKPYLRSTAKVHCSYTVCVRWTYFSLLLLIFLCVSPLHKHMRHKLFKR